MDTKQSSSTTRREGTRITSAHNVESFTKPDTFYEVHLYFAESGAVIGASCNCPSKCKPFADKHTAHVIAETYGERAPKVGTFVTPDFLEELAELSSISYFDLSQAFTGERRIVAKAVVAAAVTAECYGDADERAERRGDYCRGWAKRHGRGQYRSVLTEVTA